MKHTMLGRVKAYLAVRRALGYQLLGEGGYLLHFARYADRGGHRGPPSKDLMLRWARLSRQAKRSTWARRLQIVGAFAKYWQALEPKTQLAPRHVFGPRSPRPTPYLYSPAQMRVLLRRARRLTGARQPPTYATLLGLLACTGLRISEALRLRVSEVDFSQGLLRVSPSKYHKVRWLPLHPTTVHALHRYERCRRRFYPKAEHFFVAKDGGPLARGTVEKLFGQLRQGLAEPRRPRLHDLRHTFACRVLLRWQAQKTGAVNRLPILACYLGHNRVADTYWYLEAFPALLAQAGRHFQPLPS